MRALHPAGGGACESAYGLFAVRRLHAEHGSSAQDERPRSEYVRKHVLFNNVVVHRPFEPQSCTT